MAIWRHTVDEAVPDLLSDKNQSDTYAWRSKANKTKKINKNRAEKFQEVSPKQAAHSYIPLQNHIFPQIQF